MVGSLEGSLQGQNGGAIKGFGWVLIDSSADAGVYVPAHALCELQHLCMIWGWRGFSPCEASKNGSVDSVHIAFQPMYHPSQLPQIDVPRLSKTGQTQLNSMTQLGVCER